MSSVPTWVPAAYQSDVEVSAAKWGIRPELLAAVLSIESGFNPTAQSSAGAEGIAQFEPGTAADYGVNPWDPASAIDGAAHYLSDSEAANGGSEALALAAYNGGQGAVNASPSSTLYQQTRQYAADVLGVASGGPGAPPATAAQASSSTGNPFHYLSSADWTKAEAAWNGDTAGFTAFQNVLLTDPSSIDKTGAAYGFPGTQQAFTTLVQGLLNNATKESAAKTGPNPKNIVSSIQDVVDLVNKIVSFFTNSALRSRILLGALGVAVIVGGTYFAMNGLDGGGGGTKTRIVPLPV